MPLSAPSDRGAINQPQPTGVQSLVGSSFHPLHFVVVDSVIYMIGAMATNRMHNSAPGSWWTKSESIHLQTSFAITLEQKFVFDTLQFGY